MAKQARDPVARFSDRAEDYVKYRPHYSQDVVQAVEQACGLRPEHTIADVGCGTGLTAKIFLENGNRVVGVEPNREMRIAGQNYLAKYPNFIMVDGSAEATGLAAASTDYEQVAHKYLASYDALQRFFAPDEVKLIEQRNGQELDFDGLRGRLLSSSYVPKAGEKHEAMMRELPRLFSSHAENGHVTLEYDTKIYYGHLQ